MPRAVHESEREHALPRTETMCGQMHLQFAESLSENAVV